MKLRAAIAAFTEAAYGERLTFESAWSRTREHCEHKHH